MFKRGYKQTEEHKRKINTPERALKISQTLKGRAVRGFGWKMDMEHKQKISMSLKGKKKKPFTEEHKKNMSKAKKGFKFSNYAKEKMRLSHLGRKYKSMSEQGRKNISLAHIGTKCPWTSERNKRLVGEKALNWQGGKSFEPYAVDWTETLKRSIRERDNYVCQVCSQYGKEVHHIDYDKKNCNPNNLIILCHKCHLRTNGNRKHWRLYFI